MSTMSKKRKLPEKLPTSLVEESNAPAVKQKRTCLQSSSDTEKTLSEQDYLKLKQYLKEKKKILKVKILCYLFTLLNQ